MTAFLAPRLNTLKGDPSEIRSAVVNELHGVNRQGAKDPSTICRSYPGETEARRFHRAPRGGIFDRRGRLRIKTHQALTGGYPDEGYVKPKT